MDIKTHNFIIKLLSCFILNKKARKKYRNSHIKSSLELKNEKYVSNKFVNRVNSMGEDLGKCSYLGENCFVYHPQTTIGSFTSIAHNVIIGAGQHPTDWLTTSPLCWDVGVNQHYDGFMNGLSRILYEWPEYEACHIGNDVWLGINVVIMDGITIGDGAIIASNAVVTRDVGLYEIWGGVPAKLIKKRFSQEIIDELVELKWWNADEDVLSILPWENIEECIKILRRSKNG